MSTETRIRREKLGLCGRCGKNPPRPDRTKCEECGKKATERSILKQRKYKLLVVLHYGGSCQCCGEDNYKFLTIDHMNGGGRAHKEEIHRNTIYSWLITNNFPPGFQLLCYNCNCGREKNKGICPHKEVKIGSTIALSDIIGSLP